MPIVRSGGKLVALDSPQRSYSAFMSGPSPWASYGLGGNALAFAQMYATQPNIRTCADFLARGIADCGLHWFRRVSDTDRIRLTDFPIAQWLNHPNYATTRYRLIESLVADLALYFNAYWLKIRIAADERLGLVRLPPSDMHVVGGLLPDHYVYTPYHGAPQEVALTEVVYFNGYNPLNDLMGLSPLVTLARVLAEESAAADHRENYWRNGAQLGGFIQRPKDAPRWNATQKQSWREQFQGRHGGPEGAGSIAVLEDGMTFTPPPTTSFADAEYISARKLSRTECAAAYHIPPPFVGDLEHATFSNIKEQHKQLYADTLGPWFTMIELAIELWLLPEVKGNTADIYCEFNIAEKLKGNFEEQTASLSVAVRRAFMTANEARARLNLPRITDDPTADQLAAQQGGPATGATPDEPAAAAALAAADTMTRPALAAVPRVPLTEDTDADAA